MEEIWPGTRSIIKVDTEFMRAVEANLAIKKKQFTKTVGVAERKNITNEL